MQAFLVAYPINAQGVVAASLPNLLRTMAKKSDSWRAFKQNMDEAMKKEKPSSITHSAYSFIQQKLADLELSSIPFPIDYDKSIVLDFSGLNETAKSFYAELYLRQVWSQAYADSEETDISRRSRQLHRLTTHSLRHYAITHFAKSTNGNIVLASRFARHSNPSTTMQPQRLIRNGLHGPCVFLYAGVPAACLYSDLLLSRSLSLGFDYVLSGRSFSTS